MEERLFITSQRKVLLTYSQSKKEEDRFLAKRRRKVPLISSQCQKGRFLSKCLINMTETFQAAFIGVV